MRARHKRHNSKDLPTMAETITANTKEYIALKYQHNKLEQPTATKDDDDDNDYGKGKERQANGAARGRTCCCYVLLCQCSPCKQAIVRPTGGAQKGTVNEKKDERGK